jgi:23S rRNA (cytidine2498-2'-O)-methyltransferase
MKPGNFLFAICQRGAEQALKAELADPDEGYRLAFSRPGFVTFKLRQEADARLPARLSFVFARTCGVSLGKVSVTSSETAADEVWQIVGTDRPDHLHVWQRDPAVPGDHGFEPGISSAAAGWGRLIAQRCPQRPGTEALLPINQVARPGQLVLDCVLVEPDQLWIGWHRTNSLPSRWPGGVPKIKLPLHAVSRAYLKMDEALLWSRLPVQAGDRCVELGSSPGGSCQALLDRGLIVTGIDPAEMDDRLLEHESFTHLRARGADLKRREFRDTRWLMADSNVAPGHTLDTVEHIVTNRQVNVRGMLLTLKLPDWSLAERIPEYLHRIQSWGYPLVRARQLAFNRREICVSALQRRPNRRTSGRRRHPHRPRQ